MRKAVLHLGIDVRLLGVLLLALGISSCISEIVRKVPYGQPDGQSPLDAVTELPDLAVPDGEVTTDSTLPADGTGDQADGQPTELPPQDMQPQDSYVVGPDGGEFLFANGAGLTVPAGALSKEITLSLAPDGEAAGPDKVAPITAIWEATPPGTTFALAVTVKLPVTDTSIKAGQWPLVKGFVGDEGEFEAVAAWPDAGQDRVWLQSTHFSLLLAGLETDTGGCLAYELCDGEDNDCDGLKDEAEDLLDDDQATGCHTQGVCLLQVVPTCEGGQWLCEPKDPDNPPAGWEPEGEVSCDGLDNDCDGLTDEGLIGTLVELAEKGVPDVACAQAGVCAGQTVTAACKTKGVGSASWVCDYSKVTGYQGKTEITCDSLDNDCDGLVDENTCLLFDPCEEDEACKDGHCVEPLEGLGQSFCTATAEQCLALDSEDQLVVIEEGGTWCYVGLEHHLGECISGEWQEPPQDCALVQPINPACDPVSNVCTGGCVSDEDCVDDGNLCNGLPFCQEGQCLTDENTVVFCGQLNWACQEFECDPESGECVGTGVNNGGACDDGDLCTGAGNCFGGECLLGTPKACDDYNPCTVDGCDSETGECLFDPTEMLGAPCDDESACTNNDICQADGSCAGSPKLCDDGNPCTANGCDPASGECQFPITPAVECEDGDACTKTGVCTADGDCFAEPIDCEDYNDCTKNECYAGECIFPTDPAAGVCYYPTSEPGFQDACTPLGLCDGQGNCEPGLDLCECHSDADCVAQDDNLCDGLLGCVDSGGGILVCEPQPGTEVVCDTQADTQCTVNTCDPGSGDCNLTALPDGSYCTDDDLCTLDDGCVAGECVAPTPKMCNDNKDCTDDYCDPGSGCVFAPVAPGTACFDGDTCTLDDQCDAQGNCVPGTPKDPPCFDDDPCTVDECTENGTGCSFEPIPGCCQQDSDCDTESGEVCYLAQCCAPVCDDGQETFFQCGDDGCGSTCGTCDNDAVCYAHLCCVPNCTDPPKSCGSDGCGGQCGQCQPGESCTADFQCCEPDCLDRECGDDGCGGSCGTCLVGENCNSLTGTCEQCYPDCTGKDCGDDGCGGSCGECAQGQVCLDAGICCTPACEGLECGDDGCGGECGACLDWQACDAGLCLCDGCCESNDQCDPTETCTGEVMDDGESFVVCEEPLRAFFTSFEDEALSLPSTLFKYSYTDVNPWSVKAAVGGFNANTGEASFRYYRVPPDPGGTFSFQRVLPVTEEAETSLLSFYVKCNNAAIVWTLDVLVADDVVATLSNITCDKSWHRVTADLSPYSGLQVFQFRVTKNVYLAAELFLDDMAILVDSCPVADCVTIGVEDGACEVQLINAASCFIDYECWEQDDIHPEISCAVCKPGAAQDDWTADDSLCDDGDPQTPDICDLEYGGCFE